MTDLLELSLSVYLHPVAPADYLFEKQYKGRKYLIGPPLSFANDISLHFFGMIKNDVFDRFLKLKVITGHLAKWQGCQEDYYEKHLGRILFSVDSPYKAYHDGCTWFDDHIPLGLGGKIKVGRSNAKAHLKFGDYVDHNVPVTK
ncbi:hypothetical protein HMPREF1544_08455 [Mucor circinelloides 1006PhL]|uniref:Uncharacterized protein n=1 Tax=Mucor circinelloides f. circinelloides (strain 1006PhL) TaxID=1220926 RepID=S2J8T2_MUCC1|nr:hypothetical protein HMPREF1544_08455 [Mucor circinelloides 1006PhL]